MDHFHVLRNMGTKANFVVQHPTRRRDLEHSDVIEGTLVSVKIRIGPYRCEFGRTHPGCGLPCAEDLERAILREGPDRVAAFVAEPVMGTGGIVVPPPE